MTAYGQIVFMQGDDATEPLDILYGWQGDEYHCMYDGTSAESVDKAFDYMMQWNFDEYGKVHAAPSSGANDDHWERNGFRMSAHLGLGYIGLERILPDDSTCGTCGRTWHSAATPTPAGRCPFEYDHEDEDDGPPDYGPLDGEEIDAVIMMTRDRRILGVRAFRAGQDQSELLDSGMEDSTHPFRVELWRVGEFDPASDGFINAAERGTGGRWYQAPR